MTTETKPVVRSRTLWFNALFALLMAAEGALHLIRDVFPDEAFYSSVIFALILGNAVLRVLTTQGVSK